MTYTVYYFIVGKTYTVGEIPHKIDVELSSDLAAFPFGVVVNIAVLKAEKFLNKRYNPADRYIFVRAEVKNCGWSLTEKTAP